MARKRVQEERRIQILDALHRCLLIRPFHGTSIKHIAKEAGVNHGVLHYYFESKQDILLTYIDYVIDSYKAHYAEWFKTLDVPAADGRRFLEEILGYMTERITLNRDLSRVFIEIWEIASYDKKVRAKLQKVYMEWVRTVSGILKDMGKKEETVYRVSRALIVFFEGMALFSVIMPQKEFKTTDLLVWFENWVIDKIDE
ncbi:MAG TPA: TetR/AcrR family transcriptional regulator [Spirochaetota bacterium]|nr:TetR/AcrR family transcriptional regulator [Spirochaetota bacterium]